MAASGPHNLFMGEMGAREPSYLHSPGSRLGRSSGITWQQDTAGNWIRQLGVAAAARLETTSRGAEARSATSSRVTNTTKVPRNHQQLHRELLLTHRKGLSLRSKPELLQVLEHRNRRRDGNESILEQSPLERELQRWQQRREQRQQQEAPDNNIGNQPEFIRVRENLRRTYCSQDPHTLVSPSLKSSPFIRPHLINFQSSKVPTMPSSLIPQAETPKLQGSLEASSNSTGPPHCPVTDI